MELNKLTALITNDDGPDSPLYQSVAIAANELFEKTLLVLPLAEQSWVADAITKFRPLSVTTKEVAGIEASLIDGTPSDCVQIGCFKLAKQLPDIVISGINFGSNASLPLFMSSGTVGAASAATLAGIKSVAFSTSVPSEIFQAWEKRNFVVLGQHKKRWQTLAQTSLSILESLVSSQAWQFADFFSVNMTWNANCQTKRRITSLEPAKFGAIFDSRNDNTFKHRFKSVVRSGIIPVDSDISCLENDEISITPISMDFKPTPESQNALIASLEI